MTPITGVQEEEEEEEEEKQQQQQHKGEAVKSDLEEVREGTMT